MGSASDYGKKVLSSNRAFLQARIQTGFTVLQRSVKWLKKITQNRGTAIRE